MCLRSSPGFNGEKPFFGIQPAVRRSFPPDLSQGPKSGEDLKDGMNWRTLATVFSHMEPPAYQRETEQTMVKSGVQHAPVLPQGGAEA